MIGHQQRFAIGNCCRLILATLVNLLQADGEREAQLRCGHPSGTLKVGAKAAKQKGSMGSRTALFEVAAARVLMEGNVRISLS